MNARRNVERRGGQPGGIGRLAKRIALTAAVLFGLVAPRGAALGALPPVAEHGLPTWTVHYGGFRSLQDLVAVSPEEAWGLDAIEVSLAPGRQQQTAFVHVKDGVWRAVSFVSGLRLRALDLSGPGHGIAVGEDGKQWGFDGREWNDAGTIGDEDLLDIDLWSAEAGWAVGEIASIYRWDGTFWSKETLPRAVGASRILSVSAVSPTEAWAATANGQLLHRTAQGWTIDESAPETRSWEDVSFLTPNHGLAAGRVLAEYRDGTWREIGSVDVRYRSLAWLGDTAVVLGNDRPLRVRDGALETVGFEAGPLGEDLGGLVYRWLSAVSPTEAWVFGPGTTVTSAPSSGPGAWVWPPVKQLTTVDAVVEGQGWAGGIAIRDGFVGGDIEGAWTRSLAQEPGTIVEDIDLLSPESGWAVGQFAPPGDPLGAEGRMWRWQGETWTPYPINKLWRMTRIQMLSEDEGWASGDNVIVRWDGAEWSQVGGAPPEAAHGDFSIVRGGDEALGFFGGDGLVFRMTGDVWQSWSFNVAELIHAVTAPEEDEAWALSRNTLYRYDGASWVDATPRLPRGTILADIDAAGPNDVWLLTEPPELRHWNGARWITHDLSPLGHLSTPFRLRALRLEEDSPATDIWLAGEPPMVARFHLSKVVSTLSLPWLTR